MLFLTPFLCPSDPGSDDYLKSNKTNSFFLKQKSEINSERRQERPHVPFKPGASVRAQTQQEESAALPLRVTPLTAL